MTDAHGHSHLHAHASKRDEKALWIALALTGGFLVFEVVGAWVANSLALLSDAAHMGTDTLALVIALSALRLARKPPDALRTYGYGRIESFGALVNGGLLLLVAGWIVWEAVLRLREPPPVGSWLMLLVAIAGLGVNLAAMRVLRPREATTINLRGAYLEVWADTLGSVAVIVGAALIWATGWHWIDPVLAIGIGLWILPRAAMLARDALHLLLDGVPAGLDVVELRTAMLETDGVAAVHDLHVWAPSSTMPALTAHVVVAPDANPDTVRALLAAMLETRFDVRHATLQLESTPCELVSDTINTGVRHD